MCSTQPLSVIYKVKLSNIYLTYYRFYSIMCCGILILWRNYGNYCIEINIE